MIRKQIYLLLISILLLISCLTLDVRQPVNVYYDSWVPRFVSECCMSINGITLGHSIFIKRDKWTADSSYVLEHELVHVTQQEKYSILGFYLTYLTASLWYGYTDNPYEVEARTEAINVDVLEFSLNVFE